MLSNITFPDKIPFKNYFSAKDMFLVRADLLENNQSFQSRVASICNQTLIYQMLFQQRLKGLPYTKKDASDFINWAHAGWNKKTHFVFFIIDGQHRLVGATDIKSAELDNAEIGYWADINEPGNVTNAVRVLIETANATGFSKFTAYVRVVNKKSSRVLSRAGFEQSVDNKSREGFMCLERRITSV